MVPVVLACCLQEHLRISKAEKTSRSCAASEPLSDVLRGWSSGGSGVLTQHVNEHRVHSSSTLRLEPETEAPNAAFTAGQEVTTTAGYYVIMWLFVCCVNTLQGPKIPIFHQDNLEWRPQWCGGIY